MAAGPRHVARYADTLSANAASRACRAKMRSLSVPHATSQALAAQQLQPCLALQLLRPEHRMQAGGYGHGLHALLACQLVDQCFADRQHFATAGWHALRYPITQPLREQL